MMATSIKRTCFLLSVATFLTSGVQLAAQDCLTEISKLEAWIGEPVQLDITLYSPGPFSGKATFALPQIPDTVILTKGTPVIGSKTIAGEAQLSQRHSFLVVSQRKGVLTIPTFGIKYAGKPDFVSEPVEKVVQTQEVSFTVKLPSSSVGSRIVVSARSYSATQAWTGIESLELVPGQIISRKVTQNVGGSSAIFLTEVSDPNLAGVRTYHDALAVEDRFERGELRGQRIDLTKYRFEKPGIYQLPELKLDWWNLDEEQFESVVLDGISVTVTDHAQRSAGDTSASDRTGYSLLALGLIAAVVAVVGTVAIYQLRFRQAKLEPAAQVMRACRGGDPHAAYLSLLAWQRQCHAIRDWGPGLLREWEKLSELLYGAGEDSTWNNSSLREEFQKEIAKLRKSEVETRDALGPLNI